MIHRLALLVGGTGAAGVLAVALVLGGFGSPLSNSPDAFVPVSNDALAGGQRAAEGPTDQPTMTTSLSGGAPEAPKKVIDTVYVLPAPAPAIDRNDANQPGDKPRDPADDNNGGNNAGDDNGGDQAGEDQGDDSSVDEDEGSEDQAGVDDDSTNADQSDDGGEDAGGYETGDD